MKLQFKFNVFGVIVFLVLCWLFYAFVPLPSNAFWRGAICLVAASAFFGMCFVVVSQKSIIRKSK